MIAADPATGLPSRQTLYRVVGRLDGNPKRREVRIYRRERDAFDRVALIERRGGTVYRFDRGEIEWQPVGA